VTGEAFGQRYGRWAVVTGATDGIGLAFAEALAARGLDLVLVARRAGRLDEVSARLGQAHGVRRVPVAVDLSSGDALGRIDAATAPLDVGLLVAAAGFGTSGPLVESDPAEEAGMVAVNCTAVLGQAWLFGRRFVARGRGGIVLMSSLLAFHGTPRAANYAATKAYVQSLAEGLRAELAPAGVDVIASAPGPVASGFGARAGMRMTRAQDAASVARGTLDALGARGTVRPGALSKLLGWSISTAPRPLRVRIMGGIMGRMTEHRVGPAPSTGA
jgi:short-subunit dehydrogenase